MVTQVQFRRGTTAQHASFTGANGEITIDTDKDTVVVHDGTTAGGFPLQTATGLSANIASYLPTYTGIVNGSSHTVSSSFIANSTGVYHTGTMNAASMSLGSNWVVNSTGAYHTGTINAASYTVGSSWIANSTGGYHTGTINAASYTVGSSWIANSTGGYHTGTINAASYTVGVSTVANSSGVYAAVINASSGVYGTVQTATQGTIDHNSLSNYSANKHVDHTSVSVTAGNGLSGGGDISSTRTVSVLANSGIVANATGTFVFANTGLVANATGLHVNSSVMLTSGNQTLSGGFSLTPYNIGTVSSGTTTPAPANGNYQYLTNNGAFTLANPSTDCAIDILVTNGASAGTITFTGFTVPTGGGGDTYATTNANKYLLMIRRINSVSTYVWKALQ